MSASGLVFVIGASGAGKTAAVEELAARHLADVRCHHFDSIGVPTAAEIEREHGGPEKWQAAATRRWIERLRADAEGATVSILEGQMRPSAVRPALTAAGVKVAEIVLLDCTPEARQTRLVGPRNQPELATARMDYWAAYLRGQADALELPVIDTSTLDIATVVDRLIDIVEAVRARCAAA